MGLMTNTVLSAANASCYLVIHMIRISTEYSKEQGQGLWLLFTFAITTICRVKEER